MRCILREIIVLIVSLRWNVSLFSKNYLRCQLLVCIEGIAEITNKWFLTYNYGVMFCFFMSVRSLVSSPLWFNWYAVLACKMASVRDYRYRFVDWEYFFGESPQKSLVHVYNTRNSPHVKFLKTLCGGVSVNKAAVSHAQGLMSETHHLEFIL